MAEESDIFKKCPYCATTWATRSEFLSDPLLHLNGYQICMSDLEYGMFFFTHMKEGCCSTLAIEVFSFLDLYTGEKYTENKSLFPECPRYCVDESNLERCDAICECAYVREITHVIASSQPVYQCLT